MFEELENIFECDGSAKIGDIYFRPVSEEDSIIALRDNSPAVIRDSKEDILARFDVYNDGGKKFLGHLDLYYNRDGYLSYVERRETKDGNFEMRTSNLPARLLFGTYTFPKTRRKLTSAMMEVAKTIHEQNSESEGWESVRRTQLQSRKQMEVGVWQGV